VLKKLIALILMGVLVATVSVTGSGCKGDSKSTSK
jgi:hypothetical protein